MALDSPLAIKIPVADRFLAGLYWPGEGDPIIALHGWLDNANTMMPLLQHAYAQASTLSTRPVLALDFCGHGLSDHFPKGEQLHLVNHVQDVIEVAKHMGWQRFSLLGHSMGAAVSLVTAAAFPEQVIDLIMIDALGPQTTQQGEVAATLRKSITGMAKRVKKEPPYYASFDDAVAARMQGVFPVSDNTACLLCQRGMYYAAKGWTWTADMRLRLTSILRFSEAHADEVIAQVACPSLFFGAKQGIAGARNLTPRLKLLNNAEVVMLDGGHHLHMEEVPSVHRVIERFYTRASTSGAACAITT